MGHNPPYSERPHGRVGHPQYESTQAAIKRWRKRNPDKVKLSAKQRSDRRKDANNAYKREWRKRNKERIKEYNRQYYLANPDVMKKHQSTGHKKKKDILNELRANGCSACGYIKCFDALEFHHIGEKTGLVSQRSYGQIKSEASKCIVLCANCHRELHAGLLILEDSKCGLG